MPSLGRQGQAELYESEVSLIQTVDSRARVRPVSYCSLHSSPRSFSLQHVKNITEHHKPPKSRTGEPHPTDTSPIDFLDIRLRNHCRKEGRFKSLMNREFAVKLCLLETAKAIPMTA